MITALPHDGLGLEGDLGNRSVVAISAASARRSVRCLRVRSIMVSFWAAFFLSL